jgi:predicted Zn-dependent protease
MAFYYLSTLDNPEERIRVAFRLAKEYPGIKQFWETLSRGAVEMKQWTRALSYADKGLLRHPGDIPLLAIKAKCLNETGAPAEALKILDALLEKDPQHPVYQLEKYKSETLIQRVGTGSK